MCGVPLGLLADVGGHVWFGCYAIYLLTQAADGRGHLDAAEIICSSRAGFTVQA